MMPVLRQALAAQQPQPQPSSQPGFDPVAMLMDEYQRLAPDEGPAKPMYTPEQANERIGRNNSMVDVGLLGLLSGDRGVGAVGGQVFKQALGDRAERRTDRGIIDPLSGTETLDPEYVRALKEQRRGQILQRALAFEQSRQASADRLAGIQQHNEVLRDNALTRAAMMRAGANVNMQQVEDPSDGSMHWVNPRTMQDMGPVTVGGNPVVKTTKPSGSDEKELTSVATQMAAVQQGLEAVRSTPNAFGPSKGAADLMGDGAPGQIARYLRDNKQLTQDELASRSFIYNNVSAIIKERAGTAQSKQELRRLQGFMPSELDKGPAIEAKLRAFNDYLVEKGNAVRGKYTGPGRPVLHTGAATPPGGAGMPAGRGAGTPTPAPAAEPGELYFDPNTGKVTSAPR